MVTNRNTPLDCIPKLISSVDPEWTEDKHSLPIAPQSNPLEIHKLQTVPSLPISSSGKSPGASMLRHKATIATFKP